MPLLLLERGFDFGLGCAGTVGTTVVAVNVIPAILIASDELLAIRIPQTDQFLVIFFVFQIRMPVDKISGVVQTLEFPKAKKVLNA